MTSIHPSAVVAPQARLGKNVQIGPFCLVGPDVTLGDDVELLSHVVIEGVTTIGAGCRFYPFSSAGTAPQDIKYKGEKTRLEIGEGTVAREHVTINCGTPHGGGITRIGNNCYFMVGAHIAHDCDVGNHVIMANCATLGGHVSVGDRAVFGGLSAVLQHVRIGHHAMIGGLSAVVQDVIPFGLVKGERAKLSGLNIVGLQRSQIAHGDLRKLQRFFNQLFMSDEGTFDERLAAAESELASNALAAEIMAFARSPSRHGLLASRRRHGR